MDALDLHVEQRVGIDPDVQSARAISSASAILLARLTAASRSRNAASSANGRKLAPARRRRPAPPSPTASTSRRGQPGIGLEQPAAEGDAVGLVDDAVRDRARCRSWNTVSRIRSVCSAETPLTRCEPRKARCAHAHPPAAVLVDQRQRGQQPGIVVPGVAQRCPGAAR